MSIAAASQLTHEEFERRVLARIVWIGRLMAYRNSARRRAAVAHTPSSVTIALLVATYIALEVQIRSEEAYLENMHGDIYRNYCARVRRWL